VLVAVDFHRSPLLLRLRRVARRRIARSSDVFALGSELLTDWTRNALVSSDDQSAEIRRVGETPNASSPCPTTGGQGVGQRRWFARSMLVPRKSRPLSQSCVRDRVSLASLSAALRAVHRPKIAHAPRRVGAVRPSLPSRTSGSGRSTALDPDTRAHHQGQPRHVRPRSTVRPRDIRGCSPRARRPPKRESPLVLTVPLMRDACASRLRCR
jgi:hypothetical protein